MLISKKETLYLVHFLLLTGLFVAIGITAFNLNKTTSLTNKESSISEQSTLLGASIVASIPPEPEKVLVQYIQIINGCTTYFDEDCVNAYTGPGEENKVVAPLRVGTILKTDELVTNQGRLWYKVEFDEWLRYPERVSDYWYVASEHVRVFENIGVQELQENITYTSEKYILIDRSDQTLYAYEGDKFFMKVVVSTGLTYTPTPRGSFTIYKKTPTRYMQGPIPSISSKYYDLPGVPWNLYFTKEGGIIHGTYWHDKFGQQWSNGCVNVETSQAEKLYAWADIGIPVFVQD